MTDVEIALTTAAVVIIIFLVFMLAQRRLTPIAAVPLPLAGSINADGLSVQLSAFEGRFNNRVSAVEEKLAHTDHDVRNIRAALGALPSKDAMHRLEVQLTKTDGRVEGIASEVQATSRSLERIENFLMQKGASEP